MNILLSIINTQPSPYIIKTFAKALFSFLLVISLLASCMGTDPEDLIVNDIVDGDTTDSTAPTITCPADTDQPVALTIPAGSTELTLADVLSEVTATDDSDDAPTLTYTPAIATIMTTLVEATATDAAGNTDTCTFTVVVTQNIGSLTLTDTTIDCTGATPLMQTLDADGTPIVLAEVISGITATNNGPPIGTTPNFIYNPPMISVASTEPVTVTVRDDDGAMATRNGAEAECEFSFTVHPAPTVNPVSNARFSSCPSVENEVVAGEIVTWAQPVLMDESAEATISGPEIVPNDATDISLTGATFPAGNYRVTFTAMHGGVPIEVDGSLLTCSFEVSVSAAPPVMNGLFALDMSGVMPSQENPFLIQTAADLSNLAAVVNGETIDVEGNSFNNAFSDINGEQGEYSKAAYRLTASIILDPLVEGEDFNFTPIGVADSATVDGELVFSCTATCFEGTFDGGRKTISGLNFDDRTRVNVGLFGVISGMDASISNLILTDVDLYGSNHVGGLVGLMLDNSSINNVSIATGSVKGVLRKGGLVGSMTNSSMTNVSASVSATTGGISGGLVGGMTASSIMNAFASGEVTGSTTLGGLVGEIVDASSITNAYASGTVTGVITTTFFGGGLAGSLGDSSLKNTLAWGAVSSGFILVGGLVGSASASITGSYWDTEKTLQPTSSGLPDMGDNIDNTNYSGHETTALQGQLVPGVNTGDIYFDWDPDVWDFGNNDEYPAIKGLLVTIECQRDPDHESCP